jgi:hypothetical protein
MSKRTLFLIFALFLITFTLLMMVVYQPQAPKTTPAVVVKEPVAQTILSFGVPEIATASSTTTTLNYSLPVNISTGKNKVSAVQLEMQYDPLLLTNVKITADTFFTKPVVLIDQIDTKTGRISYAFGIGPTDQGITGNSKVATLTFSTKADIPEKTAIIFLPKTLVTAEGVAESVLKETKVGQFTVGISDSTPSPLMLDKGSDK